MPKSHRFALAGLIAAAVLFATWQILSPGIVHAGSASAPAVVTAPAETWNLGVTIEGLPTYSGLVGRLVSDLAAFRSNRGVTQISYVFPAAATNRSIHFASVNLVSRSGSYSNAATLTLRIYNFAGVLQRTASSVSINLQTAAVGDWLMLPLSAVPANLVIAPGEFLSADFNLDGPAGGTLDVRPAFAILVR